MTVIVIISVLAVIAVPQFISDSKMTRARSEVTAFFAEFSVREEQYRMDRSDYLPAAECPTSTNGVAVNITACAASGQAWGPDLGSLPAQQRLKVALPMQEAACTYQITTGTGAGTGGPAGFTFTSPAGPWYYLHARCDMDGNGAPNTEFFASSLDPTIQSNNEGQ